ncbi:unnamed protein product [Larinioides sclopetarius]|uniref:Uncharacterized protein n=1 Tax=Larinioides sclopetarius TaxID=280406 RepID=A0AAV2AVH8_9ARAC
MRNHLHVICVANVLTENTV